MQIMTTKCQITTNIPNLNEEIMSTTFFLLGFCFSTSKTAYWHKKAEFSKFFSAIKNFRTKQQKQTSDPNIILI